MAAPNFVCPFASVGGSTPYVVPCTTVRENGQVKATLAVNMTAALADLTYTAADYGYLGNLITVAHVDPGANDAGLAVSVVGRAISVSLATGAAGAITSTGAQVAAAIAASPAAAALVTVADEGDGSGVVNATAATALAGGVYHGCPVYDTTLEDCGWALAMRASAASGAKHASDVK